MDHPSHRSLLEAYDAGATLLSTDRAWAAATATDYVVVGLCPFLASYDPERAGTAILLFLELHESDQLGRDLWHFARLAGPDVAVSAPTRRRVQAAGLNRSFPVQTDAMIDPLSDELANLAAEERRNRLEQGSRACTQYWSPADVLWRGRARLASSSSLSSCTSPDELLASGLHACGLSSDHLPDLHSTSTRLVELVALGWPLDEAIEAQLASASAYVPLGLTQKRLTR